jgi:DNA repair exonuclease SbcCD ATPase subunit
MATDALKETSGALKNFDKENSAKTLAEVQQQIERMEEEYASIEGKQKEQEKRLGALTNDIARLYELKIPVDVNETDIRALEESKNTTSVTLENLQRRHEMLVQQLKELEHTSGSLAATVGKYEAESIQREYDQFADIRIRAQEAERELKLLSRQIETDKTRLEHITTHEYNPNCEFCVRNNRALVHTVEQIRKDLLASQRRREEVESVLQKASPILAKEMEVLSAYEAWQTASKELAAADRELLVIRNKMAEVNEAAIRCDIQLKEITTKIAAYYEFLDAIKQNLEIEKQISELERQRQAVLDSLRTLEVNLRELHGKLQVQKSLKVQILQQIKEIEELDQTLMAYQYYVEAVKRDGIPSELIAGVIPVLEYKINNILSQVVDFTISLEMDGKNINGKIVYDDERQWPLEMASGMERFISDLAIRSALIDVSNLPKPNFLVIDEGLSVLSPENLMSLHTLFSTLKNQFDFIVIISHLDAVRDMVDHLMEIKIGEDGFSQINY